MMFPFNCFCADWTQQYYKVYLISYKYDRGLMKKLETNYNHLETITIIPIIHISVPIGKHRWICL